MLINLAYYNAEKMGLQSTIGLMGCSIRIMDSKCNLRFVRIWFCMYHITVNFAWQCKGSDLRIQENGREKELFIK